MELPDLGYLSFHLFGPLTMRTSPPNPTPSLLPQPALRSMPLQLKFQCHLAATIEEMGPAKASEMEPATTNQTQEDHACVCVWGVGLLFRGVLMALCGAQLYFFLWMQLVHARGWPVWVDLTATALPISGERTLSVSPSIRESSLSLGGKVFALNGTVSSRIEAD